MSVKVKKSDITEVLSRADRAQVRLPTDQRGRFVAAARYLKELQGDLDGAVEALKTQFGLRQSETKDEQQLAREKLEKQEDEEVKEEAVVKEEEEEEEVKGKGRKRRRKKEEKDTGEEEKEDGGGKKERNWKVANEDNRSLVLAFHEMAKYQLENGETFKGRAYSKVAYALAKLDDPVTSGKDCLDIKGIGKSTAAKIDEFVTTGTIVRLEELRKERE